jgi:hypothetical protein
MAQTEWLIGHQLRNSRIYKDGSTGNFCSLLPADYCQLELVFDVQRVRFGDGLETR